MTDANKQASKHHWTFRLWVKIRGLLAMSVVLLGVLVGLATLLLPFDSLYKGKLELFLEQQWNMKVHVDEIHGSWKGFGPHFQLKGLTLVGKQTVKVADTSLSLNVYEFAIPGGKTGINLSITQADLAMVQSEKGHNITINNDRDEAKFTEMLDNILTTGVLSVSELNLNVANDQGDLLLSDMKAAFVLEQDSENRAMSLRVGQSDQSSLVIKSIGLKNKHLSKDAQWHLALNDFELSQFNELQSAWPLPDVVLDGNMWLTSETGVLIKAQAEIEWQLGELSGLLTWQHEGENQHWLSQFKLSELESAVGEFTDIHAQLERNEQWVTAVTDSVDLSWFNQLLPAVVSAWPKAELQGVLHDFRLDFDLNSDQIEQGHADLEVNRWQTDLMEVTKIRMLPEWNNGLLSIGFEGEGGYFKKADLFRGQLHWNQLYGQADWSISDAEAPINVNHFWCDCVDFKAEGQGQYWQVTDHSDDFSETDTEKGATQIKKMLQLQVGLENVDAAALQAYWPYQVWKPKTIEWLDKGIISGEVSKGYLFQFGQLIKKGFENKLSEFNSRAYLNDLTVQFNPEWPVAKNIQGQAMFSGLGFSADISQASSMGLKMDQAHVNMSAYKQPFIDVAVKAQAEGNAMFEYLAQTPVTKQVSLDQQMKLSGQQRVDLEIQVPLKKERKAKPMGTVQFKDAGFSTSHLDLHGLNGQVLMDGFDLNVKDMSGQLMEQAVTITGLIQTQTDSGVQMDVTLEGDMAAEQLMASQQLALPVSGTSSWKINIKNPEKQLHMNMASDLLGTEIDLPAPLNKPANSSKSFKLDCDIPCAESDILLSYGGSNADDNHDEIISRLTPSEHGLKIEQLQFKNTLTDVIDATSLGGHVSELDVDNWLAQIKQWSTGEDSGSGQNPWPLPEPSFSLYVDDMLFMARHFVGVQIEVQRLADAYQIDIDSQAMKGRLIVADDLASKGVVADFQYLHWPEALIDDLAQSTQAAEKMPDLHIFAESFSYLDIPFGELRLEMRNVIDGVRIETMSLTSDSSHIQISGDWVASIDKEGGLGVSDFSIVMTSERIATFLKTMNFEAPITDAQTLIQLYASWEGTPSMFDLKNINGTLNLKMGEGEVIDTKPGFGRVLGLFSLTNLPRRLILDFKDVMAEGLHFDSMEGQFVLKNGFAETNDFLIKASAANIKVMGLTGFADKSYQQTIVVEPQVGKTFPTLGAIAGGAVGAAAGFFVQGLLNKKLKSSNRITYQITGTWDEPVIEVIEDE